jgi:hypothetical protein
MEKKFKGTPGPWTQDRMVVTSDDDWVKPTQVVALTGQTWNGFARVIVRMNGDDTDCEDGLANARLIAAAPTMLETLERITNCNDLATAQEYAREMISKATEK